MNPVKQALNAFPTTLSRLIAASSLGVSTFPFLVLGLLNTPLTLPIGLAALLSSGTALLVGALACLGLVLRHCHRQEEKIRTLERELIAAQAAGMGREIADTARRLDRTRNGLW